MKLEKHKPFRTQFKECIKSGIAIKEKFPFCGFEHITCKKYGGECRSGKCLKDRI